MQKNLSQPSDLLNHEISFTKRGEHCYILSLQECCKEQKSLQNFFMSFWPVWMSTFSKCNTSCCCCCILWEFITFPALTFFSEVAASWFVSFFLLFFLSSFFFQQQEIPALENMIVSLTESNTTELFTTQQFLLAAKIETKILLHLLTV